uniref:Uncharacterized protein n=1 Tax=Oryza glumipatula TaxID=40148 RepID=A0A0E0AFR1_9ORYZ
MARVGVGMEEKWRRRVVASDWMAMVVATRGRRGGAASSGGKNGGQRQLYNGRWRLPLAPSSVPPAEPRSTLDSPAQLLPRWRQCGRAGAGGRAVPPPLRRPSPAAGLPPPPPAGCPAHCRAELWRKEERGREGEGKKGLTLGALEAQHGDRAQFGLSPISAATAAMASTGVKLIGECPTLSLLPLARDSHASTWTDPAFFYSSSHLLL